MTQRSASMDTQNLPVDPGEAVIGIDISSSEITSCSEAALEMLAATETAVLGQPWQDVLVNDTVTLQLLRGALDAGVHLQLPPLLLRHGVTDQRVVGGLLSPMQQGANKQCRLLLWPLWYANVEDVLRTLAPTDTVAVLGIDLLRYSAQWSTQQTDQLAAELRTHLVEIVRAQDTVAAPQGPAIVVILRDTDVAGASDICRALLSHLHGVVRPVAEARICVGLARASAKETALATLTAANRALLQAQLSGAQEPIRAAIDGDHELILGQMLTAAGVFAGRPAVVRTQEVQAAASETEQKIKSAPPLMPIETDIEGYVVDNMEGAVDQAIFLAKLDVPIAIVGPAGTGKMYVAKVIHEETGSAADLLQAIDCREFRSRSSASARMSKELAGGGGKTLVFKSPHLMHMDAQLKLAKQISSRRLADANPPQYLPDMKLIALFPDKLDVLVRRQELSSELASAFGAFPIHVPPIRDRKQAVLRWAHKILGQEGAQRDRRMAGFTPDAERAMLLYDWPGNISEMRQCIHDALEKTDKGWLTPVDLGLFEGIKPQGAPQAPESVAFLTLVEDASKSEQEYVPTTTENLDVALGEAIHDMLALELVKPLGSWLEDDLVLASLDRYRNDIPKAAVFLHTSARNIRRWMPKIESREDERGSSSLWQKPRRLLREWVRETLPPQSSPLTAMQDQLMLHLNRQAAALSSARRAQIMGVSTPTFLKRLREMEEL